MYVDATWDHIVTKVFLLPREDIMGNLRKRGNNWYIDFYANGKRVRKKVGKSKKVAELALKDAEVKVARNEYGFSQTEIAINEFFDKFLEYSQTNHSVNTTKRYRAVIDNFKSFLEENGEVALLSKITPEHIDQYKTFRKNSWINPNGVPVDDDSSKTEFTRKGAKSKTINFEIDTLRTIFNIAIKWDYLKSNPTKGITRLKADSKTPRFLTVKESQKILKQCSDELYPIFFTFLHTGMRKGELINLEWEDIDFKRRIIKIRKKDFWRPKTGEREIPISQKLYDLLSALKKTNDKGLKSSFVFPHSDGSQIKTKLRRQLIRIAEEVGVMNLTTLHALRHTFASQLVMNGVDLPTVQKLMGHSDIQTTMIYAHLAPDHLASAVEQLKFD